MLPIKGFQKTSLVDFPPNIVSTIFLPDCNFRCPYCQNPDLIFNKEKLPNIPEKDILDYLEGKKKVLDGICVTGGEPSLYDLEDFFSKVKKLGLLVKLDSNGTNPDLLKRLIDKKLVDYIAMDIKAPLDKYEDVVKLKVDKEKIQESINLIKKIDHEFRTTVVPGLISKEDVIEIGRWLKGAKKYVIQQFQSDVPLLDKSLQGRKPYPKKVLFDMKKSVERYFDEVKVVNV